MRIAIFIRCAAFLSLVLPVFAQETNSSSATSTNVVVGDPAKDAELPGAIINAYAQGARDITITAGFYRIPPTGKAAIKLENWTNAVIHAKDVTIVFEELSQRPVYLNHCEEVTLEDATLLFAEPSFTQGRVKAVGEDEKGKYIDWQVDAGYPVFDPAKSFFDVVDQHTRKLKVGTGDISANRVESSEKGLYRLRGIDARGVAVRDWLFTRRPDGGSSIIHLDDCSHCTMRGITLENAGFGAFFETGGEGSHYYVDCRVTRGPKPEAATEEPLVGCGADGFHSAGTRFGPAIERCAWEGLLHDDCIAIHGMLQKVVRSEGNKLILEKGNRAGFAAGEPVRISSKDGFYGDFNCTALRVLNQEGDLLELTLDRKSSAPAGARASNPRRNGAFFKILHCTLGNCRSRGILVKADYGLIEGCNISGCGMSAISIGPEYYWEEGDYSRNVAVKGNTLRNNVLNGSEAGVVFIHGEGAIGNGDLTVSGNLFDKNYGQIALHVEDTDGIVIANNRFIGSSISLPDHARTLLDFKSTRNIMLSRNVAEHPSDGDVAMRLGKNVEGITGNDSKGINVLGSISAPTTTNAPAATNTSAESIK